MNVHIHATLLLGQMAQALDSMANVKDSNPDWYLIAVVVSWNTISFYCTHTNHLRFTVLGINQFKSPKAKKVQQFPLNCLLFRLL